MDERVERRNDEGDDSCSSIDSPECALISLVTNRCELQGAGQDQRKILVEDNGVEDEEGPLDEGHPHVPEKGVFFVVSSDVALPKEKVEHYRHHSQNQEGNGDVVDVPEETHIGVVLLII